VKNKRKKVKFFSEKIFFLQRFLLFYFLLQEFFKDFFGKLFYLKIWQKGQINFQKKTKKKTAKNL